MKLHHFALFFLLVAVSFFLSAQVLLVTKMQRVSMKETEYDCLVAAVNATVEATFHKADSTVTKADLNLTEEVFFQTLAVLREGVTDKATWMSLREDIPCLAVFEERGYYCYYFEPGTGYQWTEMVPYEDGRIPNEFFERTEELLCNYHNLRHQSHKNYQMELAGKGVWEQSIIPPCVFAVYAPQSTSLPEDSVEFLYAASGRRYEIFYVTEDNYCHLPSCDEVKSGTIVARYATQKESAEDGAMPCKYCMK